MAAPRGRSDVDGARLGGRRILVTGAASGIGRALALRVAAEGGDVACLDLDGGALGNLASDLAATGARVATAVVDVSAPAATERAVGDVAEALGGLDGIANVAGIGGFTGDVTTAELDVWDRQLAVNLTSVFAVSRAAIPFLRAGGEGGSIVNVSSQYGLVGAVASAAYCAAKAGVIGLTRAMAVDHAPEGIRVNCVCPGPIDTPMLRRSVEESEATEGLIGTADNLRRLLVRRVGTAEEVAATIAFLLSPESAFLTGSIVAADGGWTAH
jgi:NAD(P)-dependent dehydrogenase (short-subunit alcohol dehydrogenase family)